MSNNTESNWFNIQDINSGQTSLAKVLLIFYVLIASSATDNLMSKQIKEYINDNRYVQHILGFLTMIVLVTLVGGVVDNRAAIFYALVGYIWFIFSTKLDIHWNMIIIVLLFIGYMIENSMGVREAEIRVDKTLTDEQKQKIIKDNMMYKNWIIGSVLMVTIIGTLFYSQKKHEQYGGGYDVFAYILK
jgi:hypothetical protein